MDVLCSYYLHLQVIPNTNAPLSTVLPFIPHGRLIKSTTVRGTFTKNTFVFRIHICYPPFSANSTEILWFSFHTTRIRWRRLLAELISFSFYNTWLWSGFSGYNLTHDVDLLGWKECGDWLWFLFALSWRCVAPGWLTGVTDARARTMCITSKCHSDHRDCVSDNINIIMFETLQFMVRTGRKKETRQPCKPWHQRGQEATSSYTSKKLLYWRTSCMQFISKPWDSSALRTVCECVCVRQPQLATNTTCCLRWVTPPACPRQR